jgi:hypothetical protein
MRLPGRDDARRDQLPSNQPPCLPDGREHDQNRHTARLWARGGAEHGDHHAFGRHVGEMPADGA